MNLFADIRLLGPRSETEPTFGPKGELVLLRRRVLIRLNYWPKAETIHETPRSDRRVGFVRVTVSLVSFFPDL